MLYPIKPNWQKVGKRIPLKEQKLLSNRMMHISHAFEKIDIQPKKVDIAQLIKEKLPTVSTKTRIHIAKLYATYKAVPYFVRTDVSLVLGLKPAIVSRLLKNNVSRPAFRTCFWKRQRQIPLCSILENLVNYTY